MMAGLGSEAEEPGAKSEITGASGLSSRSSYFAPAAQTKAIPPPGKRGRCKAACRKVLPARDKDCQPARAPWQRKPAMERSALLGGRRLGRAGSVVTRCRPAHT